ncbi:MAG: class II glutamine amidotransferase [Mycobacteriales bacterium]
MCRLVGWVSARPVSVRQALGPDGLEHLRQLSHQHADGWGMAWWTDQNLRVETSHRPAYSSAAYSTLTDEVQSDAGMVHLRWATPGLAVAPQNTHPFVVGDWAFGHNGAVRPALGLLDLLGADGHARLRGDTDSERLLHVLLDRLARHGVSDGLRRTVADVCRDLTPTSLNALLLGREELVALCSHGAPEAEDAAVTSGPPEDQPGYFDLRWHRRDDVVVVSSEPLGGGDWESVPNGAALRVRRADLGVELIDVGAFPLATRAREQSRRQSAAAAGP